VRNALVSATATHVQRAPDSPITRHYQELKARLGWRKARVAAARKLARVVYRMLQTGEPWKETRQGSTDGQGRAPARACGADHLPVVIGPVRSDKGS
jgi:hypothetical protein